MAGAVDKITINIVVIIIIIIIIIIIKHSMPDLIYDVNCGARLRHASNRTNDVSAPSGISSP